MHLFYYGTWLMGLLSLFSVLAIYGSNRRVIRDLKNVPAVKDKWLQQFLLEYQRNVKDDSAIHNPAVYLTRRMRGRKIGPITLRQMKGVSWCTFVLSFLLTGMSLFLIYQSDMKTFKAPVPGGEIPAFTTVMITGICMGIVLLGVRILIGTGYQEEEIETNLLDYIENSYQEPETAKIIPMENVRGAGKREKAMRQIEQGILEAAAADSRYSHLLSKEESEIVKDVVKEFLT